MLFTPPIAAPDTGHASIPQESETPPGEPIGPVTIPETLPIPVTDGSKAPVEHDSTQGWIDRLAAAGAAGIVQRKAYYANRPVQFRPAKGLDDPPHFHGYEFNPDPVHVTMIPKGRVWGLGGAVITPDNVLLNDASIDFFTFMDMKEHPAIEQFEPYPVKRVEGVAATLAFCDSRNYFHWMYDVMARVHLLRLSGVPIDKYIFNRISRGWKHYPEAGLYPFQDQTYTLMGIPRDKILETSSDFHVQADALLVSSIPFNRVYPRWVYEFLRKEMMFKHGFQMNNDLPERIYVGRGNVFRRKMINEGEVQEVLRARGFHIMTMEALSVEQQIRYFNAAKVIVAPHGATLTNLTFSQPGTKVVELFNPNYMADYFWRISNYGNLDYYYLKGEGIKDSEIGWVGEQDFRVDIAKLKELLTVAGV